MKILVICPDYSDATSYYRAFGTFKDISNRSDITFKRYESVFTPQQSGNMGATWADLIEYDVAFFQRGMGAKSITLANYLKDLGLKIWYDLDDDLWNIPDYYALKSVFTQKAMTEIEQLIKLSDLITCSTIELKKVIEAKTNKIAHVVNNAWDVKRWPIQPYNSEGKVIWRGTNTHTHDLRNCGTILKEISQHERIEFWGHNPVNNAPNLKISNYQYIAPLDPMSYFNKIRKDNVKALLVPLQDTQFNRCKSNIAWLEATASGALTYSNLIGEFKHTLDIEDYFETINHEAVYYDHVDMLLNHYTLEQANNKRIELLKGLVNG
jgi:hypothetical protein